MLFTAPGENEQQQHGRITNSRAGTVDYSNLEDAFASNDEDDSSDTADERQFIDREDPLESPNTAGPGSNRYNMFNSNGGNQYQSVSGNDPSDGSRNMSGGRLSFLSSRIFPWRGNGHSSSGTPVNNDNDGVFANLTAKPDGDKPDEEEPPSYEEAAADSTPPYWETTVLAPGLGDELFIEGLPVGSPVNFIGNVLVSAAFQFVGFFLTYLLHTSHAAKQGSRAGLGFTLLQYGYYLQPTNDDSSPSNPNEFQPSDPNNYDVSSSGGQSGSFAQGHRTAEAISATQAQESPSLWISYTLMICGGLIILKAVYDYVQARRMEIAILRGNESSEITSSEEIANETSPV